LQKESRLKNVGGGVLFKKTFLFILTFIICAGAVCLLLFVFTHCPPSARTRSLVLQFTHFGQRG